MGAGEAVLGAGEAVLGAGGQYWGTTVLVIPWDTHITRTVNAIQSITSAVLGTLGVSEKCSYQIYKYNVNSGIPMTLHWNGQICNLEFPLGN